MSTPVIVLPSSLVAGDSLAARLDGAADYAAADGWSVSLRAIGAGANLEIVGTDAGAGAWGFARTSAQTATWPPGSYLCTALISRGGERVSVAGPWLLVRPDPASATDIRSDARRALDDLLAAYRAYLGSGRLMSSYTIASRSVQFLTVADLLRAIDVAKRDVAAEELALGIAPAGADAGRYVVRM